MWAKTGSAVRAKITSGIAYQNHSRRQETNQRAKPTFFSKWSREYVQKAIDEGRAHTVYVENIPSGWAMSDIYREMSRFGSVMDVCVPGKLSWNGIRYGFVRFETRGKVEDLVMKVNKQGAIAGVFKELAGVDVSVKLLGGEYILVGFASKSAMEACINKGEQWLGNYFQMFKEWGENDHATHHLCWLNVYGTPPHAWCEEFFQQIAIRDGKFVQLSNDSDNGCNLEVARIQILTTYKEPIMRAYKALIGDRCFEVSVVEAQPPPIDHFFGEHRVGSVLQVVPLEGVLAASGDRSTLKESDKGVQKSPDPFSIFETIKRLEKGKGIMVEGSQKQSMGDEQQLFANSTGGASLNPHATLSRKDTQVAESLLPPRLTTGKMAPGASVTSNEKVAVDEVLSGSDMACNVTPFSVKANNVQVVLDGPTVMQEASLVADGLKGPKEIRDAGSQTRRLRNIEARLARIIENAKRNRWSRIKRFKKLTKSGGVRSLQSGDSSTQDAEIVKGNKRARSEESPFPMVSFKAAEAKKTMEVGQELGWEVSGQEKAVEEDNEKMIDEECSAWVRSRALS
ncbi:hypothetical protein Tsubulata_006941 [Turnera subulata]|uniref:RRM domain-containing protein n=1 Tax=Turnera subulata TaxID=218843 RepID=A0A9Q0F633_9ROSI|nr:hypothetical protein Tsubulata_006941 [Turnera subulata]